MDGYQLRCDSPLPLAIRRTSGIVALHVPARIESLSYIDTYIYIYLF